MIILLTDTGWDVIYQPAHALLASKFAYYWRRSERSPYWPELLAAIAQHDNHQRGGAGEVALTDAGAPQGFTVSSGESEISSLEQPRMVIAESLYQGRYVALLVSMHMSVLYEPKRGESKELDAFLDEQQDNQAKWRRALKVKKAQAERDYRVMIWCDRCSLILCQSQVPANNRQLEVQLTPQGEPSFLWQREDETLSVTPWLFEPDEFEISVEVSKLAQLEFASEEALELALEEATIEVKTWRFVKD